MRTVTRISLIIVLGITLLADTVADTLYFRGGEQEPGQLVEMKRDTLTFQGPEGIREVPKSEVLKVQLQQARLYDDVERADQITDPYLLAALASQPTPEQFPSAGSVAIFEQSTYDLTDPGRLKTTIRTITKVLQQRGEDVATTNVWYFDDTAVPHIDFALTVTEDGRVLHLSDSALKNESIFAQLPDYRRLSRYRFAAKEPRPGSVIDVQYTVERSLTPITEAFYTSEVFRNSEPLLGKEVVVLVPATEVERLMVNVSMPDALAASQEIVNDVARLTWTLTTPQPGIMDEPDMPPVRSFAPVLTLGYDPASPHSWEDLAREYAKLLAGAMGEDNAAVADKARELAQSGGVEAIHSYLAREVRTVDVPHNAFSLLPHTPAETLRRGLANELDKNALFAAMLHAAGIDAELAFVRGRDQGPLAPEVFGLKAFDRSLVYLPQEGRFASVVSDLLDAQTVPAALEGAPALVIGETGGGLRITPPSLAESETDTTQFSAFLDETGTLKLTITFGATGNSQAWIRRLKDADDQRLRNQLQQFAAFIHPAAVLDDYGTTHLADLTEAPALTLFCTIPNYAVTAGALMLFNIPGLQYSAADVGKPSRDYDLFWLGAEKQSTIGAITLPKGYQVYSMPGDMVVDGPVAAYTARLTAAGSTLTFRDSYVRNVVEASRELYDGYKSCKEKRAKLPLQRIILTRTSAE